MTHYFISLGSNIHPEVNVVKMLRYLLQLSPVVDISRIERTVAEGFESEHYFLNLAVRIKSRQPQPTLKQAFVQLETALGRDRNNPNRKLMDRPADLDILFSMQEGDDIPIDLFPSEPYVLPTLLDLLAHVNLKPDGESMRIQQTVRLQLDHFTIGMTPISLRLKGNRIEQLRSPGEQLLMNR